MAPPETIRITPTVMEETFHRILHEHDFMDERARKCARIFMENTLDGVYTHGVNRFARFVAYVRNKTIRVDAEPTRTVGAGALEQWNGNLGPGPLNALNCCDRSMALAREFGIGCVALANTNHWMRGGTYGWRAARAGFVFAGWTNTTALMPAWGATDSHLGNNPLVLAVPHEGEAVVLDMAMSQFSYGTMEAHQIKGTPLPIAGGYDGLGQLTTDPAEILASGRALAIGCWKGAGLALLLDLLVTLLSGGSSVSEITQRGAEYGLSQVFIAIDATRLGTPERIAQTVRDIIADYHRSTPAGDSTGIRYPGERALRLRREYTREGIPVDRIVWEKILALTTTRT